MNFLKESEKSRIIFALNLLSEKLESGYKLDSLNFKDDCMIFSNGEKQEKISIKKITEILDKETNSDIEQSDNKNTELEITENIVKESRNGPITENKILVSETSAMKGGMYGNFSETSEMYVISEMSEISNVSNIMIGGNSKNIFQKTKYSETSSLKQTDASNFSATSTDIFNGRSDKYSDTSLIKGQVGGTNLTSDILGTLGSVSELKQRKVFGTQTQTQLTTPKLDMGIFTKKSQSGGAVDSLKRRMFDVGINSNSSTTSICE